MKLSVSIMHCSWNKERVEMLKKIESKINKPLLNGFEISDDVNKNGIWWNCKEAWKMVPNDSTHHIVLQDDMIPCDNFIEILLELININSNNIIHIFGTNLCSNIFYNLKKSWFTSQDGTWGGSILLPKKHFDWYQIIDEVIVDRKKIWDDTRFNFYCMYEQHKVWHITPTLLNHEGYDKSLVNNPKANFRIENCHIKNNPSLGWKIPNEVDFGSMYQNSYTFLYMCLKKQYKNKLLKKMGFKKFSELDKFERSIYYRNKFSELKQ